MEKNIFRKTWQESWQPGTRVSTVVTISAAIVGYFVIGGAAIVCLAAVLYTVGWILNLGE